MSLLSSPLQGYDIKKITRRYPEGILMQGIRENYQLYMATVHITGHNGIDLAAPWGTPVVSALNYQCKVIDVKNDSGGYGKSVRTVSTQKIDEFYWECVYGHFSEISVEPGNIVSQGFILGKEGNTGSVTTSKNADGYWYANPYAGSHLHFGLRKLSEPRDFTYQIGFPNGESYTVENGDNGINGYIDPLPYFFDSPLFNLWSAIADLWKSINK